MGVEGICRCCLSKDVELRNIVSCITANGQRSTLHVILSKCLNLQAAANDEYSQDVCISCVEQLKNIYSFRLTVLEAYNTFESQFIKKELPEQTNVESKNIVKLEVTHEFSECDDHEDSLSVEGSVPGEGDRVKEPPASWVYCTLCTGKFREPSQLYLHCCDRHPPLNTKGESCEYCNELYPFPDILKMHKRRHLTPFICPFCSKGFHESVAYESHIRTCDEFDQPKEKHKDYKVKRRIVGSNKQMCQFCGKWYTQNYIYSHLRMHYEKKYCCKICGKKFTQPGTYKMHIRDSHSDIAKYKCKLCDKSFKFKNGRAAHIRLIHHRERNRKCLTCGKGFFSKAGLDRHFYTHSGIKNHVCTLCDKAYQTAWGLKVHVKSHNLQFSTDN